MLRPEKQGIHRNIQLGTYHEVLLDLSFLLPRPKTRPCIKAMHDACLLRIAFANSTTAAQELINILGVHRSFRQQQREGIILRLHLG